MRNATDPRTASVVWNTPIFATGSAKWTSTLSSSLLLETGFSFNRERYDNLYQDGILAERNTPAWYRNVRKNDLSTGFLWNASSAQLGNYPDRYTVSTALSRVTGSHNVKVGVLYGWGIYRRYNNANADLYQTYNNGVPLQVTVLNTPLEVQENMDGQFAVYAQDSWRFKQLHVQLRRPLRPRRAEHRRPGGPDRPLRQRRRPTTTSRCRRGATSRRARRSCGTSSATARPPSAPASTGS